MTSGIYKFTFPDGSYYIGKSSDIDKRWKQHRDNMLKAKHSIPIQIAYTKFGMPNFEVLYYAHEDHLDILESYFINSHWDDPKLLNTTRPRSLLDGEVAMMAVVPDECWQQSTFEHIKNWTATAEDRDRLHAHITELDNELDHMADEHLLEIEMIEKGTKLEIVQKVLEDVKKDRARLDTELKRLRDRNWFQRLFNIGG